MGWSDWFWGASKSTDQDPIKNLDPSLKEFLDKEQPKTYKPATVSDTEQRTSSSPDSAQSAEAKRRENLPDTNKVHEDRPLPSQSLFKDGRYAHIWKTYTPESEVIAASESPAERLNEYFKGRANSVHDIALENCAFENEIWYHCFDTGDWKERARKRATLCRKEMKAFNRCYDLQSKFLHALGYTLGASAEDERRNEAIQMHADKLYHRMLAYEKACDNARAKKQPPPPPFSVFDPDQQKAPMAIIKMTEQEKLIFKGDDFERQTPQEQELQIMARRGDQKVAGKFRDEIFDWASQEHEKRNKRQGKVVNVLGEKVGKLIVPDEPPPLQGKEPEDATKFLKLQDIANVEKRES